MAKGFDLNPDGTFSYDSTCRVVQYARAAGVLDFLTPESVEENSMSGTVDLSLLDKLSRDERFMRGFLHKLHPEVGTPRTEFRSHSRELHPDLPRSLQVVINMRTGRVHLDTDRFSPYSDVAGWLGHAFGEVVPGWFRRKNRTPA